MSERAPNRYTDGSLSFEAGVDMGRTASLISKNQVSFAVNSTFRQGFVSPRPGYVEKDYAACAQLTADSILFRADNTTVTADGYTNSCIPAPNPTGIFQCALPYISDDNRNFILLLISGKVWLYDLLQNSIQLLSNTPALENSSNRLDGWMVQAENFVVIQDGWSRPLIFDGANLRRAAVDEIKTGKVMAYVNGRIWYALQNGFSFRATDIVYGDGTRASVLKETENTFLNEGGDFSVPSDSGGITAMAVPGNLDTALGQGPLLVFTPKYVFSINAPVDRNVWKEVNYPIQAISLVTNGALASRSAITINGDVFYRAVDGIRSFIIARRDFGTWGNTPISSEMMSVVENDQTDLLWAGSAVTFDNRMIMTCQPQYRASGIIHKALAILDFELVSSMRQKLPPAWEGIWTGLDILQVLKTENAYQDRCFLITRNASLEIGIWELTKNSKNDVSSLTGYRKIQWAIETKSYNFEVPFGLKQLDSGDLFIDTMIGDIGLNVLYRPDMYPGWIQWTCNQNGIGWTDCAKMNTCGDALPCIPLTNFQPQYRSKLRLPTPRDDCDAVLNTPYRNLFEVQTRIEIDGYCRLKSLRLHAYDVQEPTVGECRNDNTNCQGLDVCPINPLTYKSEGIDSGFGIGEVCSINGVDGWSEPVYGNDGPVQNEPTSAPVIQVNPVTPLVVSEFDTISLAIVVSGEPTPELQWRKNTVNIIGENNSNLIIPNAVVGNNGSYDVTAINDSGTVTSTPSVVTVITAPVPPPSQPCYTFFLNYQLWNQSTCINSSIDWFSGPWYDPSSPVPVGTCADGPAIGAGGSYTQNETDIQNHYYQLGVSAMNAVMLTAILAGTYDGDQTIVSYGTRTNCNCTLDPCGSIFRTVTLGAIAFAVQTQYAIDPTLVTFDIVITDS